MAAEARTTILHRLKVSTLVGEVLFNPSLTAAEKVDEVKDILNSPDFPTKDVDEETTEDERLERVIGTLAWALIARNTSIRFGSKLPVAAGEQPSSEFSIAYLTSWSENLTFYLNDYRATVSEDAVALSQIQVPALLDEGYINYAANESMYALRKVVAGGSSANELLTYTKLRDAIDALNLGLKNPSQHKAQKDRTEEEVLRDRIGKLQVVLAVSKTLAEVLELDEVSLMKELNSLNPKIQRLPFTERIAKPEPHIQPAGNSGKLWDVWKTKEHVDADDGWIGLVQFDGTNYFSQGANRESFGPFKSKEAAAASLSK